MSNDLKALEDAIKKFIEDRAYGSVELSFQDGQPTTLKINRSQKINSNSQGATRNDNRNRF